MAPPPVPGPSSVRNQGGRRASGNYGTQPSSSGMSAPSIRGSLQLHIRQKAPRRPPSPSRTRRPHSDTDEEERPKKKRQKRPLQNPDSQKVILSANQRENATHQRHLGRASLSSAAASGSHRQVTIAASFLSKNARLTAEPLNQQHADKVPRNGGSSSSLGKPPTPLSQAQARATRPLTQSASARGNIFIYYSICALHRR